MQLHSNQVLQLLDQHGHPLGQIEIERRETQLILGRFIPAPTFSTVQPLFQEFEEAVNAQALSVVDTLDAAIAALGLHVRTPEGSCTALLDVQIWSDGSISCRMASTTESPTVHPTRSALPLPN